MKSPPSLGLLLLLATLPSGCFPLTHLAEVRADGSFRETRSVDGPLDLEVYSRSGNIRISGAESDEIEIVARIRARAGSVGAAEDLVRRIEEDPPIDAFGGRIVVGRGNSGRDFNRVSISYDIRVPRTTTVRAQTGSGGADISSLAGDVDVRTGSGHLSLIDIEGEIRAETGSGGIDAESIAGSFKGRTGSGTLTLSQTVAAEVDVNTGSGGIRLYGVSGPVRARAGSGGIRVEGDPSDVWFLTTGSGGVTLRVPEDAGFDLDASTNSGQVEVESPLDFDGSWDRRRRRAEGMVNAGGPSVEIRSGSGSVRIAGD